MIAECHFTSMLIDAFVLRQQQQIGSGFLLVKHASTFHDELFSKIILQQPLGYVMSCYASVISKEEQFCSNSVVELLHAAPFFRWT